MMQFPIPAGIVLVLLALFLFTRHNRQQKQVKEDRRARLRDARQKYLEEQLKGKKQADQ